MAYVSKECIEAKRKRIKEFNAKWNSNVTLKGLNTSTLTATIRKGDIDFISNFIDCKRNSPNFEYNDYSYIVKDQYIQVNHYYLDRQFCGTALEFMEELNAILHEGHWDESDSMTDYFSCAWYINIHVGKWNKPYQLNSK